MRSSKLIAWRIFHFLYFLSEWCSTILPTFPSNEIMTESITISRYETECSKTIEYQVIEEDFPDCRTEKVRSCRGDTERDASNLVSPQCRYVGVRRCKIVKRSRKKARPRHQCRRVPRKECVKVPCYQREECRVTIRLEAKELPEEKCQLLPQRICQEGECRRRLSTQCDCQETPAALP